MSFLTDITIRMATPLDAEEILKVHINCWQETYKRVIDQDYLDNLKNSFKKRLEKRNELLAYQNDNICLVAEHKGNIIGFCDAAPYPTPLKIKGEIQAIYILEKYTNQGVGTELWKQAVSYLKSKKLVPFSVLVLSRNMKARSFFERKKGKLYSNEVIEIDGKAFEKVRYIYNIC